MIRRPRPLPPRSEWRQFPPAPVDDRLRALAAADPGMCVSKYAERSPVRQPQWAAARTADRAAASGVDRDDHGPEITAEPAPVPVPVPVAVAKLDDPTPTVIPDGDPGEALAAAIRRHFEALDALDDERPLGIHPAPRSPVDPGPHDQEPAVPRWRWWQRPWTRWRQRDRKPKD